MASSRDGSDTIRCCPGQRRGRAILLDWMRDAVPLIRLWPGHRPLSLITLVANKNLFSTLNIESCKKRKENKWPLPRGCAKRRAAGKSLTDPSFQAILAMPSRIL